MCQYETMFDLKINVAHCFLYFMEVILKTFNVPMYMTGSFYKDVYRKTCHI